MTDPKLVGPLLRALDRYEGTLAVQCALRIAPLVFALPGELRKAEWKDIDFNKAEWRFIASKKNPNHIVSLVASGGRDPAGVASFEWEWALFVSQCPEQGSPDE